MRLVVTNNTEIFRHLGARAMAAIGIEYVIATDYASALALIRERRPDVAIVDADLAGGDGFTLCREVKDDPALAGVHVMLVVSSIFSRQQLERVHHSGCDDLLAVPLSTDELHRHLAQVGSIPYRGHDRLAMNATAHLQAPAGRVPVTLENLSLGGAGVVTAEAFEVGAELALELSAEAPAIPVQVVWVTARARGGDGTWLGLQFGAMSGAARALIEQMCLFDVEVDASGAAGVRLHGAIDETTDLSRLIERLAGETDVVFNMREVRYISSAGLRQWCAFLAQLGECRYAFRHASLAFASQVAMVPMAAGSGEILSFEAPYRCESCDRDELRLLETAALLCDGDDVIPPTLRCADCGDDLLFDDLPDRYLAFARGR